MMDANRRVVLGAHIYERIFFKACAYMEGKQVGDIIGLAMINGNGSTLGLNCRKD